MSASPSVLVSIQNVCLQSGKRSLSLDVHEGESYAIMGPAASGKTMLLNLMAGRARPESGSVVLNGTVTSPSATTSKKLTPLAIAQANRPKGDAERVVRALTALELAELRDTSYTKLSPVQQAACEILPCFVNPSPIVTIDGYLDLLDPWTLDNIIDFIAAEKESGRAFIVTTSNLLVAEALENLIILRRCEAKFAGTTRELIDRCRPTELEIECDDQSAVRNMVEPFSVSVSASPGVLMVVANRGQELAAHLLTYGYGNVKSVIVKEPTLHEAILSVK